MTLFIHPSLNAFFERTGMAPVGAGPFCDLDETSTAQQVATAYRHAESAAFRYACDSDATGEYRAVNAWQGYRNLRAVADEAQRLADLAQGE